MTPAPICVVPLLTWSSVAPPSVSNAEPVVIPSASPMISAVRRRAQMSARSMCTTETSLQ